MISRLRYASAYQSVTVVFHHICGEWTYCGIPFRRFHRSSYCSSRIRNDMLPSEKPQPKPAGFTTDPQKSFSPSRVLVLTKITRYEFEKRTHPDLTEEQLAQSLAKKGSDLRKLKELHDYHINQAKKIVSCLKDAGIETQIANRYEYTPESIRWADAIFTAGGDGTYLLGASKLKDPSKPLIGINTDPRRSEGYLCLPKVASLNFKACLDKLFAGEFRWFNRQRIRIDLSGPHACDPPIELHEQQLRFAEQRFTDWIPDILGTENEQRPWQALENLEDNTDSRPDSVEVNDDVVSGSCRRVLPVTALNEVFIGESLSSRVSYYEMSVDDGPSAKQKSSGVTVCTGTGSTSWSFNINKLTQQATSSMIRIIRESSHLPLPTQDEYAALVTRKFNEELIFDPSDQKMLYTVRDPVSNMTYSAANPRGFAKKVVIKSRCYDASLVIDGGSCYKFNDGAHVTLTVHPDDALRTVELLW